MPKGVEQGSKEDAMRGAVSVFLQVGIEERAEQVYRSRLPEDVEEGVFGLVYSDKEIKRLTIHKRIEALEDRKNIFDSEDRLRLKVEYDLQRCGLDSLRRKQEEGSDFFRKLEGELLDLDHKSPYKWENYTDGERGAITLEQEADAIHGRTRSGRRSLRNMHNRKLNELQWREFYQEGSDQELLPWWEFDQERFDQKLSPWRDRLWQLHLQEQEDEQMRRYLQEKEQIRRVQEELLQQEQMRKVQDNKWNNEKYITMKTGVVGVGARSYVGELNVLRAGGRHDGSSPETRAGRAEIEAGAQNHEGVLLIEKPQEMVNEGSGRLKVGMHFFPTLPVIETD